MTAIATARAALRNVAIAMGQMERATTATMASAATDRRMQPRVCKLAAEIEAALKELTEGVKEGAKIEDIAAVALTESVTVRLTTAGT